MTSSPRRRRALPVILATALALSSVLASAAPAMAHDQLTGSEPVADATVDTLPGEIVLTFSAELLGETGGNEVQVTDATGTSLGDGPVVVDGTTITQALTPGATGAITVLWRAVSSDGHPISGEFAFDVAAAPEPSSAATEEETAPPTVAPTAEPTETAVPLDDADDASAATSGFGDALPWIIGGLLLAGIGGAVVYLLLARARRGAGEGGSGRGAAR